MPADLPLMAILRGITPDQIIAHAQALDEHGFARIEVPTNSPAWQTSVARLVAQYGDRWAIGAGTVLEHEQVDRLAATGARLMVTPNTDPAIIRHAKARGLQAIIGALSPTEALAAIAAGADALKIFPCHALGPKYIAALRAILPAQVPVIAVGGVTPENLRGYIEAGCATAGLGGELYRSGQSVDDTRAKAATFERAWREIAP